MHGRPVMQSTSCGKATLMMVWSMDVTRRARTRTPRIRHRFGWLALGLACGLHNRTTVHDCSFGRALM